MINHNAAVLPLRLSADDRLRGCLRLPKPSRNANIPSLAPSFFGVLAAYLATVAILYVLEFRHLRLLHPNDSAWKILRRCAANLTAREFIEKAKTPPSTTA
jgi:hypothetical protein